MKDVKEKKAADFDCISDEAWIYGGKDLINKLICVICGKIWEGPIFLKTVKQE